MNCTVIHMNLHCNTYVGFVVYGPCVRPAIGLTHQCMSALLCTHDEIPTTKYVEEEEGFVTAQIIKVIEETSHCGAPLLAPSQLSRDTSVSKIDPSKV